MKCNSLAVVALLCAATGAHAQWPAYPYPYPYPTYYYPAPQPQYYYLGPYPVYYGPLYHAPEASVAISDDAPIAPAKLLPVTKAKRAIKAAPVQETAPPEATPPEPDHFTMMWNAVADWARNPGEPLPRNETWWLNGGYMGAFLRPMHVNGPLVTTGSILDTSPGAVGSPNTRVLFGDNRINDNLASGFSLSAGRFLDPEHRLSIESTIFFVTANNTNTSFQGDGNGNPLLTRPVFATDLGRQAVFFNSFPGALDGRLDVSFRSNLGSAELNGRYDAFSGSRFRSDLLLGFRYARLEDRMQIQESINALPGTTIPFNGQNFTNLVNSDSFNSVNQFFGGQLGGRVAYDHPWFNLALFGKLALGGTLQQVNINGSTAFLSPAGAVTAPGGVLALPSNIGTYQRSVFGILPELGFNVGLKVTDHVRADMGYSALLWNRVARGGSNIDTSVNTGLAPGAPNYGVVTGPVAPTFRFNDEFFWTHTFRLGLTVSY
ncbi:MAG TPA: BBP7 family outer membrane beta-barrel protein [Gemmataceae bacterium]|nr:BBP7 family outer membrane beta-barrel protein [Gemmataceae bacterium]